MFCAIVILRAVLEKKNYNESYIMRTGQEKIKCNNNGLRKMKAFLGGNNFIKQKHPTVNFIKNLQSWEIF
jgi:hypothetical protein